MGNIVALIFMLPVALSLWVGFIYIAIYAWNDVKKGTGRR